MKQIILLAGAAMLATTGPAYAKPNHAGHGNPAKHAKHGKNGKGQHARIHDDGRVNYGYGNGHCPPGLAKQNPRCMPPGQFKKFNVGQRLPYGYQGLLGYNALPYDVRDHYGRQLDPYGRYYYDNQYLYRVDPTTMVVQQVLSAILR